ncbi:MAG: Eco57I restriction-modification methylase domain-containing protein [Pirellulales bacterium]
MKVGELVQFAAEQQQRHDASTSASERRERGHFGTPAAIAQFMAEMFSAIPEGTVRILDPGAGVGTLSAAICQRLLAERSRRYVLFELWENDPSLIATLEATMNQCQKALRAAGHELRFNIRVDDFILANTQRNLFENGPQASFDLAILNPPYFKLRKDSPHARAMGHVVHGQPNIYALFMAASADLLVPCGEMVAITPRSYFNGSYFKRFRRWLLDRMTVRQIHVFESRSDAFRGDSVLQENVILRAEKGGKPKDVVLTNCVGRDLRALVRNSVAYDKVIDNSNEESVIRVTMSRFEHELVTSMDSLPARFRSLGFEISTGPVVTFRATKLLRFERAEDTAPLFWMHNVRPFVTQMLSKNRKPTHIEISQSSKKLLVRAEWYVLLKRFTAKEEKRRLVAGIVNPSDSYSEWVGLENHLNYVYRRNARLTRPEAYGLAAFFNSAFVDRYFRAISGNTQVNAAEIRCMPVPDQQTLEKIGEKIQEYDLKDCATVENVVGQAIGLPCYLIDELVEAAR